MRDEEIVEPTAAPQAESIAGITDFTADLEGEELNEIVMNKSSCYYLNYKNSAIYNLTTSDNHEVFFQATGKEFTGQTTKGVKLQSTKSQVFKAYGLPDITHTTRGENIFVYKTSGLIIRLKKDFVSGWVVYRRY